VLPSSSAAWLDRGACARAALPRATRSVAVRCGAGGRVAGVRSVVMGAIVRRA
jgi:hypothetical protein